MTEPAKPSDTDMAVDLTAIQTCHGITSVSGVCKCDGCVAARRALYAEAIVEEVRREMHGKNGTTRELTTGEMEFIHQLVKGEHEPHV